jgi:hypothetical protein
MKKVIELVLEETEGLNGINAISIVEHPAIEENFITLAKEYEVEFKAQDEEKRILMGAALIPNKTIYRNQGGEEFYVYFSKETVRKASELFLMRGYQGNTTLEHAAELSGLSVVESWIVEDPQKDKTAIYGMELPEGTWMVSMKVNNEDIWNNYVKTGRVKGFSIEGYFVDKMQMESHLERIEEEEAEFMLSNIIAKIKKDGRLKSKKRIEMESYTDYPEAVRNNAKRGIELNEKGGNKCATAVGKIKSQQLADGKPISVETITRMYSYLSRAEAYYDENDTQACGTISYLLWGGLAAKRWAESKLKELGKL